MARHCLTDIQWEILVAHWPQRRGPRSRADDRNFVNAVIWMARTGAPWRDLDPCFGSWKRIYNRFRRWSRRGWWLDIFRSTPVSEQVGSILDASIVRAHQDSSGGKEGPVSNAIGL